jgi:L,D-transpeptidase catalytic domain
MPLQKQKEKKISSLPVVTLSGFANDKYLNEDIDLLYSSLKLQQKGLSKQAFEYACKGYRRLLKKRIISKEGYLVICDFSQSSNNKRLYLVDMINSEVLLNTYVAHGRNSGGEYATRFSNRARSLQSSLGFYVTQNTYYGEHGLSLRMRGLEAGYNDKAGKRRVVVHGADYIGDSWLQQNNYMGRSYGCPAIPEKESNFLINTIKNGSCIFIYHHSKSYLKGSKILNG